MRRSRRTHVLHPVLLSELAKRVAWPRETVERVVWGLLRELERFDQGRAITLPVQHHPDTGLVVLNFDALTEADVAPLARRVKQPPLVVLQISRAWAAMTSDGLRVQQDN